jgi:hypothetical protein
MNKKEYVNPLPVLLTVLGSWWDGILCKGISNLTFQVGHALSDAVKWLLADRH